MTKICNKCKKEKSENEFSKRKSSKDGLNTICKSCQKEYNKNYYLKNSQKIKSHQLEYYYNNRNEINEKRKGEKKVDYYIKNKERIDKYYYDNKEVILERVKNYRKIHRKEINEYIRNRKKSDIKFKISITLRNRFSKVINEIYNTSSKTEKFKELLGCSLDFFMSYIENQFEEGMTWKNHGQYGWHFDHIIPISSFDLTKEEDIKKCFHYTNIQPLWWHDNLKKGKKVLTKNQESDIINQRHIKSVETV